MAALANIADQPSLDALAAVRNRASGQVRELAAEAYVACADQFRVRGNRATAVSVYRQMIEPGEPPMTRIRALTGLTGADGKGALPYLTAAIESGHSQMQPVAIRLLNGIPGPYITKALTAEVPKVPPFAQVHLLTALAYRGDVSARPALLAALKSNVSEVRAAALAGLGKLGGESSVMTLAEAAAAGKEPEQSAARRSLSELRGPGIDRTITAAIGSSSGKVRAELILAAGERVSLSAADALVHVAQENGPRRPSRGLAGIAERGWLRSGPAIARFTCEGFHRVGAKGCHANAGNGPQEIAITADWRSDLSVPERLRYSMRGSA